MERGLFLVVHCEGIIFWVMCLRGIIFWGHIVGGDFGEVVFCGVCLWW